MQGYRPTTVHLILICALSLLLAACGPANSPHAASARPTAIVTQFPSSHPGASQPATYLRPGVWRIGAVRAILTSAFPENHIPPFDRTSTSALRAQQLYDALLALPVMPSGTYYCPVDWGDMYHLRFFDDSSRLVATALVKPDGCETVILPNGSQRWTALSPAFWATFAAAMNVSISTLRNPAPNPDGPSAPVSLPD